MKKVINITLGSRVFAIEQEAFTVLETYLGDVRRSLSAEDDVAEIISDIETALAEKFSALGKSERIAVTEQDVQNAKTEMGTPADFSNEPTESATATNAESTNTNKRLYRDTDDSIIAGVASGLAQYFSIDPVIVRIIFVLAFFFNGIGLLAYIILWLVVPVASTTEQRYAMRGDRVTLKEISDRVKKNIDDNQDEVARVASSSWSKTKMFIDRIFKVFGAVVRGLLKVSGYIIGFFSILVGALTLAGLVSAYSIILLSEKSFLPLEAQSAVGVLISNPVGILAMTASFIMMAIPFLVLIIIGGSLLVKRSLFTVGKSIALLVVWIVALVVAVTASALQAEKVIEEVGPVEIDGEVYELQVIRDRHGVSVEFVEMNNGIRETAEQTSRELELIEAELEQEMQQIIEELEEDTEKLQ